MNANKFTFVGCKSEPKETKISIGASGKQISAQVYDLMINRNWRRSGTFFYQPENNKTCCRMFAYILPIF